MEQFLRRQLRAGFAGRQWAEWIRNSRRVLREESVHCLTALMFSVKILIKLLTILFLNSE